MSCFPKYGRVLNVLYDFLNDYIVVLKWFEFDVDLSISSRTKVIMWCFTQTIIIGFLCFPHSYDPR